MLLTRYLQSYGYPNMRDCYSALGMLDKEASPIECSGGATSGGTRGEPGKLSVQGGIRKKFSKATEVTWKAVNVHRWSRRMQSLSHHLSF